MISRQAIQVLATQAGFGGQLRNTHAVKIELLVKLVEEMVIRERTNFQNPLDGVLISGSIH